MNNYSLFIHTKNPTLPKQIHTVHIHKPPMFCFFQMPQKKKKINTEIQFQTKISTAQKQKILNHSKNIRFQKFCFWQTNAVLIFVCI